MLLCIFICLHSLIYSLFSKGHLEINVILLPVLSWDECPLLWNYSSHSYEGKMFFIKGDDGIVACSFVFNYFALKSKELITLCSSIPLHCESPTSFFKPVGEIPESGKQVLSARCPSKYWNNIQIYKVYGELKQYTKSRCGVGLLTKCPRQVFAYGNLTTKLEIIAFLKGKSLYPDRSITSDIP